MPKPGGEASPDKVASAQRQREALELRKGGATYVEIGQALGISFQAAHKRVQKGLLEVRAVCTEEAEELLALALERLDRMLLGIMPQAEAGDLHAIDRVLKVEDQRAKLLGQYITLIKDVSEDAPLTAEEAIELQNQLLARAGKVRPLDYSPPPPHGDNGGPDSGGNGAEP